MTQQARPALDRLHQGKLGPPGTLFCQMKYCLLHLLFDRSDLCHPTPKHLSQQKIRICLGVFFFFGLLIPIHTRIWPRLTAVQVRIVRSPKRLGLIRARLLGAQHAKGERGGCLCESIVLIF